MKKVLVKLHDLPGYVVTLETAYVLLRTLDALLAVRDVTQSPSDGISHPLNVVGSHVKGIGTSGFLKTGTCACYNGQPTADRRDDGDAKALVDGRIYECLGMGIIGRKLFVVNFVEHDDPVCKLMFFSIGFYLVSIGGMTAYDDQRQISR